MKRIGLTQRMEYLKDYGEKRDCLDQRWTKLLFPMGLLPIPLINTAQDIPFYLDQMKLDGVILTGGNDLASIPDGENKAPERDRFERMLIDFCTRESKPLLGVCRGMQMLNVYYDGRLQKVMNHAAVRHPILFTGFPFMDIQERLTTNSFHGYGLTKKDLGKKMKGLAFAEDGTVEAMTHVSLPQYGIMWHPEREFPPSDFDINLISDIFDPNGEQRT